MDKLQVTFPAAVLDLFQQLGNSDVMQFEAGSWTGGLLSVMLQRQDGHVTINIDGIETAVAESVDGRWCCGMKAITSNVLLTTAAVSTDANGNAPLATAPVADPSLPPTATGNDDGDESVDTLPHDIATPSTVLQMAACQSMPLVSTLNHTQLQLICSGITDAIDDPARDPSIVDVDTWRTLLDTANINQQVAPPDGEAVAAVTETAATPRPPPQAQDPTGVQCSICGNSYQLFGSLYKHVRETHRADPRYRDALKHLQHIRFRRLKRKSALVLACWLCGEQCFGHQLFKHISVVHGERDDIKTLMERAKKLYGREARAVYKRVATGGTRVPCTHCRRSFARKYVKTHEARCRRADTAAFLARLACDVCGKQFASRKAVYEHRRRVHRLLAGAKLVRAHKCHVCGREFPAPAKLRCHMITHTGERNHSCEVCGRAFRDAYTMRHHHKTVHLGQYRFHCAACGRHFDKLRRLRHHRCTPATRSVNSTQTDQVAHSTADATSSVEGTDRPPGNPAPGVGDVPTDTKVEVTCDLCGRTCRDTAALKAHRRVVHHVFLTKPTPKFTCVLCEKDFSSRAKLNAHGLIHSDVRQYVCAVCQRAFKDPYTMKHHHQTQHLHEYRFRCDACHRPFDKRSHLQRHKCNPAVSKSFSYRPASPKPTCSESLIPSDGDKEEPPKKRCRKSSVHGTKGGEIDGCITPDDSSDPCDRTSTSKAGQCVGDNHSNAKPSGVLSVEDMDAKAVGETGEWNSVAACSDDRVSMEVLTPVDAAQGTGEVVSEQLDAVEVLGTAAERATDNIEAIRSCVVAECVKSASDDQRVVLAYQVTAAKRSSRKNQDRCSPAPREGDLVRHQRIPSGQKTPGSILVTFMPADMVNHRHKLQQCDRTTTSTADNNKSLRPSSDSCVDQRSAKTGNGNVPNSPARHKMNAVVSKKENEPTDLVASVDRSSRGVDSVGQLTPSRRSVRQEHRRMLKTRQTQIV